MVFISSFPLLLYFKWFELQMSTLIIVVDLDCRKCYHKIRKILCQLQDHERIRTISFDDKSKTVTMVGPFDPQRLACKLRCKGGKVVRDVYIVDANGGGGGKPPPPPQNVPDDGPPAPAPAPVRSGGKSKNKNKNKDKQQQPPPTERPPSPPPPPPPETAPGPPPPEAMMPPSPVHVHHHPPPPPDRGMAAVVPQPQYVEERPPRAELEPQPPMSPPPKEMRPPMDLPPAPPSPQPQHHPPMPGNERPPPPPMPTPMPAECVIPTVEIPSWPAAPPVGVGPCGCPCCAPCYQGYYEGCRCYCCGGSGRMYGTTVRPLPAPCGAYRGCRTFSDDDPSAACSVM